MSPPFTYEQLDPPFESPMREADVLAGSGKTLVSLIAEKGRATDEVKEHFESLRMKINDLYYKLDKKIATVLAIAQMDQVMGVDSSEKSSLASVRIEKPNQLTLVALNSLISRKYTQEEKGCGGEKRQVPVIPNYIPSTRTAALPLYLKSCLSR